jgi:hypothetical protein
MQIYICERIIHCSLKILGGGRFELKLISSKRSRRHTSLVTVMKFLGKNHFRLKYIFSHAALLSKHVIKCEERIYVKYIWKQSVQKKFKCKRNYLKIKENSVEEYNNYVWKLLVSRCLCHKRRK